MIRRPPRSTLFPYHDALPICRVMCGRSYAKDVPQLARRDCFASDAIAAIESPLEADLHGDARLQRRFDRGDRKSTRLNSSHLVISYAVFCLKNKITSSIAA